MRNSSLVEESCAENVTGQHITEAAVPTGFIRREVGERCQGAEALGVSQSGALTSENAGMGQWGISSIVEREIAQTAG